MSDLLTILNHNRGPAILKYHQIGGSSARRSAEQPTAQHDRDGDQVDLSREARALIHESRDPQMRYALVQRVRDDIARGDYLTSQKIDFVVDRLHQELRR